MILLRMNYDLFEAKILNSLKPLPRFPDCLKTTDYTIQLRTSRTEYDSILESLSVIICGDSRDPQPVWNRGTTE